MSIDEMIAQPGFYEVSTRAMHAAGFYTVVEVEADGTVHQIAPSGERDGVLGRDGWSPDVIVVRATKRPGAQP